MVPLDQSEFLHGASHQTNNQRHCGTPHTIQQCMVNFNYVVHKMNKCELLHNFSMYFLLFFESFFIRTSFLISFGSSIGISQFSHRFGIGLVPTIHWCVKVQMSDLNLSSNCRHEFGNAAQKALYIL